MKINQSSKIQIAKRTGLGRMLCRLAGDRTGAVMMEYVILGVLIAAAATLAAIFFGKGIVSSFSTMTHATAGNTKDAQDQAKKNQDGAKEAADKSEESRKGMTGNNEANK